VIEFPYKILGRIISDGDSPEFWFLNTSGVIWRQSFGDPRSPERPAEKLGGDHTWPISIPLPTTVQPLTKTYRLPGTFLERDVRASITYDLAIRISRGRFRKDDL
jgi:hypothetical protein